VKRNVKQFYVVIYTYFISSDVRICNVSLIEKSKKDILLKFTIGTSAKGNSFQNNLQVEIYKVRQMLVSNSVLISTD
jgi:hypothetical protein